MTGLFVLKEKIVGFYKNYEWFVKTIAKFILAFLAFGYVNTELGYLESLTGTTPTLFLSVICAIVPVSVFVLIFALVVVLHLYKLSAMLSLVALIVFLLFYFIYLKFAPNQGILIVLYAVLSQYNLHYMVPLIGAMAFNPFAAVPIACGVIFSKVLEYLKDAASLGDPGMDVQGIMTSYQYVFDKLLADKEMVAYIVVFTIVIVVAYAISRLSINYSWYIAIAAGTIINIAGLAMMGSGVEGVSIGMVVVGSVVGGLIAALGQLMGCTLDYARKEYLQFEDDDYYYYVKAIPKIQITQEERTVKSFGEKEEKPKKEKKSRRKRSKKGEEQNIEMNEEHVEEAVMRHFDEEPPVQETRTFEPIKVKEPVAREGHTFESIRFDEPESKKEPVSDFDELSFEGFDFDNLD